MPIVLDNNITFQGSTDLGVVRTFPATNTGNL